MLSKSKSYVGLWKGGGLMVNKIIHFLEKLNKKKNKKHTNNDFAC